MFVRACVRVWWQEGNSCPQFRDLLCPKDFCLSHHWSFAHSRQQTFKLYSAGEGHTTFVCVHGGGHTALSFAQVAVRCSTSKITRTPSDTKKPVDAHVQALRRPIIKHACTHDRAQARDQTRKLAQFAHHKSLHATLVINNLQQSSLLYPR